MKQIHNLIIVGIAALGFMLCVGCKKTPTAEDLKPQIADLIQKSAFWIQGYGYGGSVKLVATDVTISAISDQGIKVVTKATVKAKPASWDRNLQPADLEDSYTIEDTYEFQTSDSGWFIVTKPYDNKTWHSKRYPK